MWELQIPPKIIRMVKAIMAKTIWRVRIQNELSEISQTTRIEIRQRDGLACLLFNLAVEKIVRQANANGSGTILLKSIQILACANDIDIVARSVNDLVSRSISRISRRRQMGLTINEKKTKILISTKMKMRMYSSGQNLTIGNYNFQITDIFRYLGLNINNENDISKEISQRG